MNFTLTRGRFALYGILGQLKSEDGSLLFCTLEHAYQQKDGSFLPKLAPGTYTCVRHPPNRLPYETFVVQGVPPFMGAPVAGILIHKGNYNNDSEGCILIGMRFGTGMIEDSKDAFDQFMTAQEGVNEFQFTVT